MEIAALFAGHGALKLSLSSRGGGAGPADRAVAGPVFLVVGGEAPSGKPRPFSVHVGR